MQCSIESVIPKVIFENYNILKTLGEGSYSYVFLVEKISAPEKKYALKVLKSHKLDPDILDRFVREFEVLRTLRHKNLISAYDLIKQDGVTAYLMEHIEGFNLHELLADKKISHEKIDDIFSQLLLALDVLHQNGLAHRDIKLENILLSSEGEIKLSDLGLMKNLDRVDKTAGGILLGTSQYLPPEYVKHNIYDYRSDLYACGLMLFECLVGKRWMAGKNGDQAIKYLCERNFEFPKLALSGLPSKYQTILKKALSTQPWKRYKNASEMREALLSNGTSESSSDTHKLSENLCIKSAHSRRMTESFLSQKARKQRIIVGILGIVCSLTIILALGFASYGNFELEILEGKSETMSNLHLQF